MRDWQVQPPPETPGPSTGWHHLRVGWKTLDSPLPRGWLTLFFHFPPCLVNEAGEALGFKKTTVSAKGEKPALWGGRAPEKLMAAEGVSQAAWVRMLCGTPVLERGRICKTGKTKIAKGWTTAELCRKRAGLRGMGEEPASKSLQENAQALLSLDHRTPMIASWRI